MSSTVSTLPFQQIAALKPAMTLRSRANACNYYAALVIFSGCFAGRPTARGGAEVFIDKIGKFVAISQRILTSRQSGFGPPHRSRGMVLGPGEWLALLRRYVADCVCRHVTRRRSAGSFFAFLAVARTSRAAVRSASRHAAFWSSAAPFPRLVFALIFVFAFGLGPLPGILAIAIHTTGALGKLYAEVVENIDMKPVEGIVATGGNWFAAVRFAVMPQVLPNFSPTHCCASRSMFAGPRHGLCWRWRHRPGTDRSPSAVLLFGRLGDSAPDYRRRS